MIDLMEKALAAVRSWPPERQRDAAEMLLALDRLDARSYLASDDELRAIDEGLVEAERGAFATEEEIEAAFRRFRE